MHYFEMTSFFRTDEPIQADRDLSSALRGIWGRALKGIYCNQKQLDCAECDFTNCTYYVLFEKKHSESGGYHPYVIQAKFLRPGLIAAKFKFFGWICEHSEKLVYSLIRTGGRRIMLRGRGYKLELVGIADAEGQKIYDPGQTTVRRPEPAQIDFSPEECQEMLLTFKTPLRQKSRGSLMPDLNWDSFAKSLIHRIRYIDEHFNRKGLGLPDNIDISLSEAPEARLNWSEKLRKSFRQGSRMSIGGLTGSVRLRGPSPEMVGILKLGARLHAGKQCTFGNGEMEIKMSGIRRKPEYI